MAKKKMGRPPSTDPRIHAVMVKYTESEYEKVRSFAKRDRVPLAVLVREKSLTKARPRKNP